MDADYDIKTVGRMVAGSGPVVGEGELAGLKKMRAAADET